MAGYYDGYSDRYYGGEVGYDRYLLPDPRERDWGSADYDYYDSRERYYPERSRPLIEQTPRLLPRGQRPREAPQSDARGRGRGKPDMWMHCDVCNVRIHGMPSWRQHMSGKKHQTALAERKASGTTGAAVKTLTAAAQSKPATSSASVQSNPGNTQRQSGQQTGVAAKKSTIQPLMGKNLTGVTGIHAVFEEVTSTFRLHKDEPIVGLEFAVLHYYEREATADLECLLCNESVNAKTNARIEHFTSFVHRVTYIRRVGTQEELSLVNKVTDGANGVKNERFRLVKELSIKLEERNGRRANDIQKSSHANRETTGKSAVAKPATTTVAALLPTSTAPSGQGVPKTQFWEDDTSGIGFDRKPTVQGQKQPLLELNKPQTTQTSQSGSSGQPQRRLVPSLMSLRQGGDRSSTTTGALTSQPVPLAVGVRRPNESGDSDQPPAKKLAATAMLTLSTLANFLNKDNSDLISTDAEAEAAMQLSQALSQAVFEYRNKKARQQQSLY